MCKHRTSDHFFTRKRKLGFKEVVTNLMSFSRTSVQTELDRFSKSLFHNANCFDLISKSAFTQARKKVSDDVFKDLANQQLSYFKKHAPHQRTWKGYRVVAIDGSLLNLPHADDIEKEFGSVSNQHDKIISARCSFAYDVLNELVLDATIAPRRSCEKDLAISHLDHLNPSTDILVFDRGYPAQWLIGLLLKLGFKFCFRLSTAWKNATKALMLEGSDINWTMVHNTHKKSSHMKKYEIPSSINGLRLMSIDLISGEKEVLLTNLKNKQDFNVQEMSKLYQMRWGVEESYKTFKKSLHIEHFSGRTALSIKQDFYAKVLMLNLSSMVRTQAIDATTKKGDNKHPQKANKTQVLAKVKDFLIDIFYTKGIKMAIEQMLSILVSRLDIIRPNRSFARPDTSSRRRCKIMNHKGI